MGSDIEIVPRKVYIGFKRKTNFIDIKIQGNDLLTWINLKKGEMDDPNGLCKDVSSENHNGNGDYSLSITQNSDLDYIMFLVKQSYKKQGL